MRAPLKPTKAYALREFRRFLQAIGFSDRPSEDQLVALIKAMQETARKRGMSEYEIDTTYDADALLDIYRETVARSS
jgi:hypothetical protein